MKHINNVDSEYMNTYMNAYLTGFYDQYLIKFMTIQSILLTIISKFNLYCTDSLVYKQLVELNDFKLYDKLRYCAQYGYVKNIKLFIVSQFPFIYLNIDNLKCYNFSVFGCDI